jgi:Trypsin
MSRELMGVVSWGEGCARENYSGVNARITAAADWIDNRICELSSFPPDWCPSRTPPVSNAQDPSTDGRPGGSSGGPNNPDSILSEFDMNESSNNPPSFSIGNTPLAAGQGAGGTSQQDFSYLYPGNGPMVATNAVTVNILYRTVSQQVRWSMARETETGQWEALYQSSRGYSDELDSRPFTGLAKGWYRFTLIDPRATPDLPRDEQSIQWASIMAPRGMQIWGTDYGFTQNQYTVFFEINQVGVPAWGLRPDVKSFTPP